VTISGVDVGGLDAREARTLLERRPDVADRRVRRLFLTDAGRDLLRRASELAQEYERRVSEPFSEAERAQLLELLDRIATGLGLPPGVHAALRDDG
jgi:DNA-binding MarR family transcriptional regulator